MRSRSRVHREAVNRIGGWLRLVSIRGAAQFTLAEHLKRAYVYELIHLEATAS